MCTGFFSSSLHTCAWDNKLWRKKEIFLNMQKKRARRRGKTRSQLFSTAFSSRIHAHLYMRISDRLFGRFLLAIQCKQTHNKLRTVTFIVFIFVRCVLSTLTEEHRERERKQTEYLDSVFISIFICASSNLYFATQLEFIRWVRTQATSSQSVVNAHTHPSAVELSHSISILL